ncbi:DsbA family protein [Pantoea sp. SORGH_AS_0659]|uniref:DsbA family protein n=1 Tax=Pantoea sp. SORGH_AS_0659 TaxID=3062597 RepID=UPI002855A964|nr:DsbA family protein [Pantoea sp. SORGH_AS_0659]MDR6352510.1 thiol:disulfide interchange protein DsbA [Pantoea sp. SORGH_AS_0659]
MKSVFLFVVLTLAAALFWCSSELSAEVEKLDAPVAGMADITEVFSFHCPHCRAFSQRAKVSSALAQLARVNDISYEKYHVDWGDSGKALSEAWAVAVTLHLQEEISEALFTAVQDSKSIKTQNDIYTLFSNFQVSREKYTETLNHPDTQSFLDRQSRAIKALNVTSVPAVYIAGMLKINNGIIGKDSGPEADYVREYIEVVSKLLKIGLT